ncbi:unnamed protein product [Adineta steineri]|uniref:Uncharacterized protein n=1 Tax=Adineta steineri TaxID=433720 RepID=A0A814XUG4_9BILA|nr:unnamed protein product [Adineta steineri]CAF3804256.1 unnamed protein product [Adineta steineri]
MKNISVQISNHEQLLNLQDQFPNLYDYEYIDYVLSNLYEFYEHLIEIKKKFKLVRCQSLHIVSFNKFNFDDNDDGAPLILCC